MNWAYDLLHVTRFHCLLIGATGAILYFNSNLLFIRFIDNFLMQAIAWMIIFLVAINKFHFISFLDNEFIAIITVVLIIGQIRVNYRIINLDISILDFLGKISYGMYVIHPLVIFYLSKIVSVSDGMISGYAEIYFLIFLVTILAAYLSYEFFEMRFLRLKRKYSAIKSS
ncbi:MAG: hypothetical protein WDN75_03420 [Bacteroidota bacterium]